MEDGLHDRFAVGPHDRGGRRCDRRLGAFVPPEPTIQLARPARLAIEFAIWAAAAAALWFSGLHPLGVIFFVVAVASGIANEVWD